MRKVLEFDLWLIIPEFGTGNRIIRANPGIALYLFEYETYVKKNQAHF
jgi:hypothetical protein